MLHYDKGNSTKIMKQTVTEKQLYSTRISLPNWKVVDGLNLYITTWNHRKCVAQSGQTRQAYRKHEESVEAGSAT